MRIILVLAFYIYFALTGICTLWFNYDYAKKNAFIDWILFGEIVATAKAVIWPYYAYQGYIRKSRRDGYSSNYNDVSNAFTKEQLADMTATVWVAANPSIKNSKNCIYNQLVNHFSKDELKLIVYGQTEEDKNKITRILQQKQNVIGVCFQ